MGRRHRLARILLTAVASVCLLAAVPVAVTQALASSAIAITTGACSGGGSVFCFDPEAATGVVGSQVTWTNQSGVAHALTRCTPSVCPGAPTGTGSDAFSLSIGSASGSAWSFTFAHPGTYYYYCTIHGYGLMHGALTVAAAPTPTPSPTASAPSASATAAPGTGRKPTPVTPGTGGAPGSLGGWLVLTGVAALLLAAATTRRR